MLLKSILAAGIFSNFSVMSNTLLIVRVLREGCSGAALRTATTFFFEVSFLFLEHLIELDDCVVILVEMVFAALVEMVFAAAGVVMDFLDILTV